MKVTEGGGSLSSSGALETSLVLQPQSGKPLTPLDPTTYVSDITYSSPGKLSVAYDSRLAALRFDLPPGSPGPDKPTSPMLDEVGFTITNPGPAPVALPLVFQKVGSFSITGLSAILCFSDGTPTGIPIQISKDWHQNAADPLIQQPWYRGCGMIHLAPGETAKLRLRVPRLLDAISCLCNHYG